MIIILTYQDLQDKGTNDSDRMLFVLSCINDHKSSKLYKIADVAEEYDRQCNTTIKAYQKLLYDINGTAIPDNYSANYKLTSNFFNRFTTQQNQYLLGNGVQWDNEDTKTKLGEDFDTRLQEAGKKALVHGVSFGFFNKDHLDVFSLLEFVPLYDEENGALMAGIRFWQVDTLKPLRATLYEMDGYTEYIWKDNNKGEIKQAKRPYKLKVRSTEVDGEVIYDGENYPSFPIVPLWGNPHKQSELIGIRSQIDAYDLIKSGFCNTIDEASFIYWAISNGEGMDDMDLVKFKERMMTLHAAVVEAGNGAKAEAHSLEAPFEGRAQLLELISKDLYRDYMALDTANIGAGAITATEIKAAYEPMNTKSVQYEYCVLDFLKKILYLIGVDDKPSFTRSMIINAQEEIQTVLQAETVLDAEYTTRKVLELLGDGDKADEVLQRKQAEEMTRMDDFAMEGDIDNEGVAQSVRTGDVLEKAEEAKGKTLNGAQTQSLIDIVKQYKTGNLTLNQAASIIAQSIGISRQEAIKLLKDEDEEV